MVSAASPNQPAPAAASAPARGRVVTVARALRWALAVVLVALTVRLIAVNPAPFRDLADIEVHMLAVMVLLVVFNQWLMSRRFQLVMKHCAGVTLSTGRW
ncbi:MAG TPA: hypothetical protein VMG12_05520, partial [Polyangiaceae bacterium]|nr:hypothetical protein [Polyangiaceae bacterium]